MSKILTTPTEIRNVSSKYENQLPLVELHILRATGGELLNRGFDGRHKTLMHGGVRRARVSPQSKKHPIRLHMEEEDRDTVLTKQFPQIVKRELIDEGSDDFTLQVSDNVFKDKEVLKASNDEKLGLITSQAMLITTNDVKEFARVITDSSARHHGDLKKATSEAAKTLAANAVSVKATACTALNGRMAATPAMNEVYGAVKFSHAYSVNAYAGDVDDFTACDDYLAQMGVVLTDDGDKPVRLTGSAHMDSVDISANTYYSYVQISEKILFENLLRGRTAEDADELLDVTKKYTRRFIEEVIKTLPEAKQNNMATYSEPAVVYITEGIRVSPHTMDLAFERAVVAEHGNSVCDEAVERLKKEIYMQKHGAFAVNTYTHEYWLSDFYDEPDEVERVCLRDIEI